MSYLAGMADLSRIATGGLLTAAWQGILLAGVAGLVLRLLPSTPAAVRFVIWFAVFVVVTGLPVAAVWPQGTGPVRVGEPGAWLTLDARWSLAIAAVWAVASLVRACTLAAAAFRVRTLWKAAKPVELDGAGGMHPALHKSAVQDWIPGDSDPTRRYADTVSRRLPTGRRAQICTSDEVDRPTVIGFFAPKILIPTWLLKKLTEPELEQIVLHETGHLGRADDWMNLLQKIALVVFPLNPALAWVERRLCFERELACDERVLRTTQAPKAYAACLATLAEHRMGRRGLALALGALGRESELGRRVGRILRRGETMRPAHAKLVLGGAMLGLLVGAVGLGRCPQVIGFVKAGDAAAAVSVPSRVGSRLRSGDRNQYEAVVFHPDAVRAHGGEIAGRRGLVASRARGSSHVCANTPPCTMKVREHEAPRLSRSTRAVQWVVLTSWQSEDGARMVLTTARTSSASARVFSAMSAGLVDPEQAQERDQERQFEEVCPYAAVPVRGGWLVFQL